MLLDYLYRLNRAIGFALGRAAEGIARAGGTITAPIEWMLAATVGRFFHMFEQFECVEDWLRAVVRLATWPLRITWRLAAAAARLVVPATMAASLGRWHEASIYYRKRVAAATWELAERLNLDAPLRWLAWLLQPVWRPLASIVGFGYAWALTRPYRKMMWGLPVLAAVVPLSIAAAWSLTWGRDSLAAWYRVAADDARDRSDYETMQLFERKLDQLGVDSNHTNFEAAIALAKEGKVDEAYERMKLLAPAGAAGYPAAHHWILAQLLAGALNVDEPERLKLSEEHLEQLTKTRIKDDGIDLLRAMYLAQTGQLEQAAALLEPLINTMEIAALQRMEIDRQLGRTEESVRDARALTLHFEEEASRGKSIDSDRYQAWTEAAKLLGDDAEWARLVRAWLAVDADNKLARQNVATLDRREFDDMLKTSHPNGGELAKRLSEVMRLMDDATSLEPQVVNLYIHRQESPAIDEMFRILMASADAPTALNAILGAAAAGTGDVPTARRLLGQVVESDPKNAVAWNNYAWALAQEPDQDLAQALTAVNRALELSPEEFRFRETRGQILVTLGKWQEAVGDLEFALNGMPDLKPIHMALATAYDHLGDTDLAEIHRQQTQ